MSETFTPELCRAVVEDVAQLAADRYVYPDAGREIARALRARLEEGNYDELTEAGALALVLTEDLQALSNDGHWSVVYDPEALEVNVDPEEEDDQARLEQWLAHARRRNFRFEKVERMSGNVGYVDLRGFAPAEFAGSTAVAAMGLVAHCDALIFDLRRNHGGYPSMVQLLTSYLFEPESRHINTFHYRPADDYQQFWTFPYVPGQRLPEVPVYVLTSRATGSAAEEFAYNLKQMERATLVGETTAGVAHPVTMEVVQAHFQVRLPHGRPINPITGDNWEGSGVKPHLAVPQQDALRTAHLHALEHLVEHCPDEKQKRDLAWETEIVERRYTPVRIAESTLARYAGRYGQRCFALEEGILTYAHQARPVSWPLAPLSETRFHLDGDLKFEFLLDEQGQASTVVISYRDGRPEITVARTS
jgi:hypothetical protein